MPKSENTHTTRRTMIGTAATMLAASPAMAAGDNRDSELMRLCARFEDVADALSSAYERDDDAGAAIMDRVGPEPAAARVHFQFRTREQQAEVAHWNLARNRAAIATLATPESRAVKRLAAEVSRLEARIAAAPANTPEGMRAKLRLLNRGDDTWLDSPEGALASSIIRDAMRRLAS